MQGYFFFFEDISVDLKLDTLCLSLFYCQQDLSVYFISIIGASGDTDDSAFVVLWDNHHVVTSRPMDSAIMEQPASLITQCQVWICACSPPPSIPCPSYIPCVSVSICGAASSVCTSSMACGWVGIMVWICACSPPSSLPSPSSIPSVSVSICGAASSGCTSSTNTHISCSGQPSCGNFKAYGFCNYGASCKFDHPVPVNPYHYAGLTMPSMPTTYGSGFGSVLVLLLLQFLVQVTFLVFQFQSVVLHPPTALLPWHVAGTNGASGDTADSAFVVLRDNHHVVTSRSMDSAIMEQAANMITQCKLYSETIQHPNIRRTLITTNTTAMSRLFLLDRFFHGMWLVSICGAASSNCTSSMACGWVGIMVWICACSPLSLLPCPSSIPSVSVSICDISVDLKLDTLCLSLFYCQQDLSVYFISTNGASGDLVYYAFVVLGDNHHEGSGFGSVLVLLLPQFLVFQFQSVVLHPPTALLSWHVAGLYSETIQHPNIRRTLITTNTTAMSRLFLLDRFFHGMWLVSICGAASSDCTSSMACGWVGIMVWICACSPPSSLPCPSSIPSVSVSICGAASSGCTSSTNTHISCSVLHLTNGASGDTDDSAFVVLRDNHHVVTSRPMDSAIMEQAASLITQCQLYSETIQHPNIRRTLITTNTTAMSRPFLLDRFFHGMWLVSICGAASSDCTSSMACGWGQPACANFKAYGLCKYGASCKFDHPVPVNPYQYAGFTMLYMPTAYAPPVSTQVRITSPPSLSDSTTVSNGDKSAAENKSSETEKQDEIAGLITKPL
ncbi:hypothetical protein HID58_011453 [Brassica napus]|uniref:C3H1-type domain-containing protein n=1 Tax=Brassica napus TaxID=3708 RepID=A0ABQ8DY89_BRANA|nr:hypothetical protein HID58_011453 [Brassica napus]